MENHEKEFADEIIYKLVEDKTTLAELDLSPEEKETVMTRLAIKFTASGSTDLTEFLSETTLTPEEISEIKKESESVQSEISMTGYGCHKNT